jgi:hypothetical protein
MIYKSVHIKLEIGQHFTKNQGWTYVLLEDKGNNKITELWTILQRESQNS